MKVQSIPENQWPYMGGGKAPVRVFLSEKFLIQEFLENDGVVRITVNHKKRRGNNWMDGITWDELQDVKASIGYADSYAIEVYPKDKDIVNVANMRHLWVKKLCKLT